MFIRPRLIRTPVEPGAGIVDDVLFARKTNKKAACAALLSALRAGDPQTYALLYCSVFKERTLTPGPSRTGSLTAPERRAVRATTDIIPSGHKRVKAKTKGRCARLARNSLFLILRFQNTNGVRSS